MLFVALLGTACTTIQIPVPGASIMRPRAGLADAGARVTVGVTDAASIEGTMAEVKDSAGNVINPLPGELDPEGDEVPETTPLPVIELGVDWKERFEFGLSTSRGYFFMWDYALWKNAALTLTPSYSSVSAEGGDPKIETTTDENGEEVNELDYSFEGKATNFNVTQLASAWVGSLKWAALYVYGGVGANFVDAEIKHKASGAKEKESQVMPSSVFGLQLRLLIFELTAEAGTTTVEYRDGTKKTVTTGGGAFSMHIAI
jgi:hypothetical protein